MFPQAGLRINTKEEVMCFKLPRRVGAAFMPFWFATLLSGVAMPYWCHAEPSDVENTTAHFQSTYVCPKRPTMPIAAQFRYTAHAYTLNTEFETFPNMG